MPFRNRLDTQLRELAWSWESKERDPITGLMPVDPREHDATDGEYLAGCYALLRAYTRMIKLLQRRIDLTTDEAIARGATFGQVATATGVTRQAVRQRHLRRSALDQGIRQPAARMGRPMVAGAEAAPDEQRTVVRPALPRGSRVRVHELATETGLTSREVMDRLRDMGEFVASASALVAPPVARELRKAVAGERADQGPATPASDPSPDPSAGAGAPTP